MDKLAEHFIYHAKKMTKYQPLVVITGTRKNEGILMGDYYYDNTNIESDQNSVVIIDRVYCLDFDKFDDANWSKLGEIYNLLPHKIDTHLPCWFGIEGENQFYLCASVEPSGLQIFGELKECDWIKWESVFNKYLHMFPLFYV